MLEFGHVLLTVAAVLIAAAFVIAFGHPRHNRMPRMRAHA
jgi:low temperature requirement protein LtrA